MNSEETLLVNEESRNIITEHFGTSWVGVTALGMLQMMDIGIVHSLNEAIVWGLNQPNQEEHHQTMQMAYEYLKENAEIFGLIVDITNSVND